MEALPLKFQWNMLEKIVGNNVVSNIKNNLRKAKLNNFNLYAIRKEREEIILIGHYVYKERNFFDSITKGFISKYNLKGEIIREESLKDNANFEELRDRNIEENIRNAKKFIKSVKVYPECLEKVSEKIGKRLDPIDTRTLHSYFIENGKFLLRLKAKLVDADAIVDFSEKEYCVYQGVWHSGYGTGNVATENLKFSIGVPVKII